MADNGIVYEDPIDETFLERDAKKRYEMTW